MLALSKTALFKAISLIYCLRLVMKTQLVLEDHTETLLLLVTLSASAVRLCHTPFHPHLSRQWERPAWGINPLAATDLPALPASALPDVSWGRRSKLAG